MAMIVPQYERREVVQAQNPVGVAAAQSGFGQVAKGLADVGGMFDQWQADVDEADAKAADTAFSDRVRKTLYEDGSGYLYAQGGDAMARRKAAADTLQKDYDDILGGLSPNARVMAEKSMESRRQSALQSVDTHAGGERITYLNGQADARMKSAIDDAIIDPAHIGRSLSIARGEIAETGARMGWAPEAVAEKQREAEGAIHGGIVTRLSNVDPQQALDYLNANRGNMRAQDVARMEGMLLPEVKRRRGVAAADAAFEGGNVDAASLIRSVEGFRETPYWDVNALRAGYGSDTVTREDGTVERVGKGTQVSRADAERDLQRRISTEYAPAVVKAIGAEAFHAMSAAQQAVLVSLTYNYGAGSWGKGLAGVAQAVKSGGVGDVVDAIRALGSHNEGINAKRRNAEAALYGNGAGRAPGGNRLLDAQEAILDIEDPDVRAAAMQQMNARINLFEAQTKAAQDAAAQQAFVLIEGGGSIDDLSLEQKATIGRETVSSLRSYEEKLRKGDTVQTDPALYVELTKEASANPQAFAGRDLVGLLGSGKLDRTDFEAFSKQQGEAVKARKPEDAMTVSTINTVTSDLLKASGINDKDKAGAAQSAKLQELLLRWDMDFRKQSGGVAPTHAEIRDKAAGLLAPVILNPPGPWNEVTSTAVDPKIGGVALDELAKSDLSIDGKAVPPTAVQAVIDMLSAPVGAGGLGRPPNAQEVIEVLQDAAASGNI